MFLRAHCCPAELWSFWFRGGLCPALHNLFDKACAAFPWPVNKADYYSFTTASRNSCIPEKFQGEVCVLNWANKKSLKGLFGISSLWVRPTHCSQPHWGDKGEAPWVQNAEVSHLQEKWVAEQVDWHNSKISLAEHFSWGVLNAGGTFPSLFLQKVNYSSFRHCCCPLFYIEEHYSDREMCISYGTGDLFILSLFPELPIASTAWEKFAAQPSHAGVSSVQKHTLLGITKHTLSSRRGRTGLTESKIELELQNLPFKPLLTCRSGDLGQDSTGLCVHYLVLLLVLSLSSQHDDLPASPTACPAELSLKDCCQPLSTGRMSQRGWDRVNTPKMGDTSLCNQGKSQKETLWYFLLFIGDSKLATTFLHIVHELLWNYLPGLSKQLNRTTVWCCVNDSANPIWPIQEDKLLRK